MSWWCWGLRNISRPIPSIPKTGIAAESRYPGARDRIRDRLFPGCQLILCQPLEPDRGRGIEVTDRSYRPSRHGRPRVQVETRPLAPSVVQVSGESNHCRIVHAQAHAGQIKADVPPARFFLHSFPQRSVRRYPSRHDDFVRTRVRSRLQSLLDELINDRRLEAGCNIRKLSAGSKPLSLLLNSATWFLTAVLSPLKLKS